MKNLLKKYAAAFIGVITLVSLVGIQQALATFSPVGGGTYLLQSSISATQTTITLTSFAEPGSSIPLTMTYMNSAIEYGTINPSSGNSEFISFTGVTQNANGSATLTGIVRGLARTPGTGGCVASSTLAHAYPGQTQFILSNSPCYYSQYAVKQNNETITGQWTFSVFPITPASPAASETTAGISELAIGSEAAAGTLTGGTGFRLVLPTSLASSTFATSSSNVIPVTDSNNHIPAGFVASSTGFSVSGTFQTNSTTTITATSSATIGAFPAWQIGKQLKVFTSTGVNTFTVPSGITRVLIEEVGGGGQGGGASASAGAGGGAGGYASKSVDVSGTSSIQITVGTGGSGAGANSTGNSGSLSAFGPSTASFYTVSNGGNGGPANVGAGGTGGSASGGDINTNGGKGASGASSAPGVGGSSFFGGDGAYGSGGSGCVSGSTCAGSGGQNGIVIVSW